MIMSLLLTYEIPRVEILSGELIILTEVSLRMDHAVDGEKPRRIFNRVEKLGLSLHIFLCDAHTPALVLDTVTQHCLLRDLMGWQMFQSMQFYVS